MADPVDWELAATTGARLARPGPEVSAAEAREVVAALREAADRAVAPVAEATGLVCPSGSAETVVVDRPAWVRSNVAGFRAIAGPTLRRLADGSGGAGSAVGSRVTGVQLGAVLAWLSGKVLGQYEAFTADGQAPRLLLVAPNIRATEETLRLDAADFRLWVALHEETHRVQFGAVPWLGQHLRAEIEVLLALTHTDAGELAGRLLAASRAVREGGSLADCLQTPEQRVLVERITAVMSLLEGHADHVMDIAAPSLIPTLPTIRERFNDRRRSPGTVEAVIRRVLGLDAKLRQYSDGAAFVRAVIAREGMAGFNAVWARPEALPAMEEIHAPERWIARVLDGPAA